MSQASQQKAAAGEMKLDQSLDIMIQRVNEMKASINQFLYKLDHEHETLSWPSVLDSLALLSSQINSFQKIIASDKTSQLKSYVFVPTLLNPARDAHIEKLTEGRVMAFNHEVVPDYLRTKPEMAVEKKIKTCRDRSSFLSPEATNKQINMFNKICNSLLNTIQSKREEWKGDESSRRIPETSSAADTKILVAAVTQGKSLVDPRPSMMVHPGMRSEMHQQPTPYHVMHRAPVPTINMASSPGPARMVRPNVRMAPYPYGNPNR